MWLTMTHHQDGDPYRELGVDRSDDDGKIREAYRRIAKDHHPDITGCPEDSARFREATQAYEAIREDRERRHDVADCPSSGEGVRVTRTPRRDRRQPFGQPFADPFGPDTSTPRSTAGPFGRSGRRSPPEQRVVEFAALLTPTEAITGGTFTPVITVPLRCPGCGDSPFASLLCPYCRGTGHLEQEVTCSLAIPAGISHGTELDIPIEGHPDTCIRVTVLISR